MSSCSASGEAKSSYGEGLCPRSYSLASHLLTSRKVESSLHSLLVFFHQAELLLQYTPVASALWCLWQRLDTEPPCPPPPTFTPPAVYMPLDLVVTVVGFPFLPYHISTLCPYICFLCPANSIDSAYPSRPWSNSTSSLNPRSRGWVSGALSSSLYPK